MGKGLRFVQNEGLRFVQNDMAGNSAKMSFRVRSVIPGAARNLITSRWGCRIRFFTPLCFVQNDMAGGNLSGRRVRSDVNTT